MNCKEIGEMSFNSYLKLGKSGKPNPKTEYTVLSTIICEKTLSDERKVVSLSTGTKCYPLNQSLKDNLIVDSHAESLLKRSFKRYLISCLNSGLKIDTNITINVFISQLPCGSVQRWKADPSVSDANRKPGRGEVCLKPTCLKKLAKWVYMGLQGKRLIALTKEPLYITNIFIGNCGQKGEFGPQVVANWFTLGDSCLTYSPFKTKHLPQIKFCQQFRNELFIKCDSKQPTPTALVMWSTGDGQTVSEVLTEGHRLGLTKKNMARSEPLVSDSTINRDIDLLTADRDLKLCENYENQWNELKKCDLFDGWPSSGSS